MTDPLTMEARAAYVVFARRKGGDAAPLLLRDMRRRDAFVDGYRECALFREWRQKPGAEEPGRRRKKEA